MNATTTVCPTLKQGSTGQDVNKLQQILNITGANLVIDGFFGIKTLQAVITFQKQHNLTADGIINFQTWSQLDFTSEPRPILRRGSRGDVVAYLQRRLNGIGFGPLVVDGIFGRATEKSVKKFQAYYGLAVDGIIGK